MKKALTYESIQPVLAENKNNILGDLNANYAHFLSGVLSILTGVSTNWGGEYVRSLKEEEKQQIKTYLGIN